MSGSNKIYMSQERFKQAIAIKFYGLLPANILTYENEHANTHFFHKNDQQIYRIYTISRFWGKINTTCGNKMDQENF